MWFLIGALPFPGDGGGSLSVRSVTVKGGAGVLLVLELLSNSEGLGVEASHRPSKMLATLSGPKKLLEGCGSPRVMLRERFCGGCRGVCCFTGCFIGFQ